MAPPSRIHQKISGQIYKIIANYIDSHHGLCEVYPAPFAVNLDANDKKLVEPDVSVICDPDKPTDRGCSGAPDLVFEVVSPASRKMDYTLKNTIYAQAESGILDHRSSQGARHRFSTMKNDVAPVIYGFDQDVPVGILPRLTICIQDILTTWQK